MPITLYPGTVKKRNANGTYSDLVPGADISSNLSADIADAYDPVSGVYSADDYCIYQTILYKCITDVSTPEAFDNTKWEAVTVGDELTAIADDLETETDEIKNT